MLAVLESVKSKLEPGEERDFVRRITSLNSNIAYWNKQLGPNKVEAQSELARCYQLLTKVSKDLKKAEERD